VFYFTTQRGGEGVSLYGISVIVNNARDVIRFIYEYFKVLAYHVGEVGKLGHIALVRNGKDVVCEFNVVCYTGVVLSNGLALLGALSIPKVSLKGCKNTCREREAYSDPSKYRRVENGGNICDRHDACNTAHNDERYRKPVVLCIIGIVFVPIRIASLLGFTGP